MHRRTRPLPKLRIVIDLTGEDRERWKAYALRRGLAVETMIADSVEAAIKRDATHLELDRTSVLCGCARCSRAH